METELFHSTKTTVTTKLYFDENDSLFKADGFAYTYVYLQDTESYRVVEVTVNVVGDDIDLVVKSFNEKFISHLKRICNPSKIRYNALFTESLGPSFR
jgi:hypothetical protein